MMDDDDDEDEDEDAGTYPVYFPSYSMVALYYF
jgi:hypothetical protein